MKKGYVVALPANITLTFAYNFIIFKIKQWI